MRREEIEKIYDQGKDAVVDNSSKPPSSDDLSKEKKGTRSMRKRSGKKSGGQEGHPGETLNMTTDPDKRVRLRVKGCQCCGKSLKGVKSKDYDKRQDIDIPLLEVMITEYQSEMKDCSHCGKENTALFPEGITHKVQ